MQITQGNLKLRNDLIQFENIKTEYGIRSTLAIQTRESQLMSARKLWQYSATLFSETTRVTSHWLE